MPPELSPPPSSLSPLDALTRAVAQAAAEVDHLAAARRALGELAAHWQGGHRAHYEDTLAGLERRSAQLGEALRAGRLALRRAAEAADAADAANAGLAAGAGR